MFNKKFVLTTILIVVTLLVSTAYVGPTSRAQNGFQLAQRIIDKVKKGEKLIFRVSYHDVSNEFAPDIKKGVDAAAKEFNVDAVMVGPVGAKAEDQIAELESLIQKGVDGLAISSVSTDALAPVINKALAAGIPVVTFNTDNPSSNRLAFVGQDLVQSGRSAGDLMANQINGKGVVLITTLDAAAQWSLDREKGAREALGKYPGITIKATINTGTEPQAIYSAIENAMIANKDVTGILSLECCSTPAAGEYVKRNNLKDKVSVVGFDLLPTTLQLIKDGYIQKTIGQGPERQGHDAVKLLMDAVNGKQVQGIDTGAEVVDLSNVDSKMQPAATPAATQAVAAATFKLAQRIADKVKSGGKLVFRVSYHDVSNEFAPDIKKGVDAAAKEFNVDAVMVGPVGAKAEDQIAELESLIQKGVDGLAISSVSTDALAPVINKALAAGIPVVTFNTDNPSSNRLAFVGQDLVQSGRSAGDLMANQINGKGVVLITTLDAAAQWSLDREKGAREALGKYPGITIKATINTGTEPQAIYSAIENAMIANKDVTGILSLECCSTPAAGEYVKRNNLKDKVSVVGFDLLPTTLQLIKDGYIQKTIGQGPERQGHDAVKLLMDAVNGKQVQGIDTGAEVVDLSNVDSKMQPAATAAATASK